MDFFNISGDAICHLKKKDKKLAAAIDLIEPFLRETNPDLFSALVHSIVGQQISAKAAQTVWLRMTDALGEISSEAILNYTVEQLQMFGMTFRKAGYIRNVAELVFDGRLDINALHEKSDAQVVAELIKVDGIGVWTAEMLMIFSMKRQDILSYGDLAILRGMRMLYRHKKITKELFEKYRKRYSPYGSVASLYLWAIAGGAIEDLTDPVAKSS